MDITTKSKPVKVRAVMTHIFARGVAVFAELNK
jgi:hypothetical protein